VPHNNRPAIVRRIAHIVSEKKRLEVYFWIIPSLGNHVRTSKWSHKFWILRLLGNYYSHVVYKFIRYGNVYCGCFESDPEGPPLKADVPYNHYQFEDGDAIPRVLPSFVLVHYFYEPKLAKFCGDQILTTIPKRFSATPNGHIGK
jgi:hypothetical protein